MANPAHLENRETAPWSVEYVRSTTSTQTDLLARAESGTLVDRTALRTDFQTAGRGRLDRRWTAPAGTNLLVSLGFVTVPADPGEPMRRVGVAVVEALAGLGVTSVGLKWPNDVLIDGRKVAGMLAQRSAAGPVVVGLGLNVGWAPEGATKLSLHSPTSPAAVLIRILEAFDAASADPVYDRYRTHLNTLGQHVRVELPNETVTGIAVAVGERGELDIRTVDGSTRRVTIGDVTHLRRLDPDGS